MVKKEFVLVNNLGLHSRAAALFVQLTNNYVAEINIIKDDRIIDGKSIMGILCLGISQGDSIVVEVTGIDEEELLLKVEQLLLVELV